MAAQSRNIAELENASVWRLLVQYSLPSIAGMVVRFVAVDQALCEASPLVADTL